MGWGDDWPRMMGRCCSLLAAAKINMLTCRAVPLSLPTPLFKPRSKPPSLIARHQTEQGARGLGGLGAFWNKLGERHRIFNMHDPGAKAQPAREAITE